MYKTKYTKEQLIFFLKELSKKINRTPKISDLNKKNNLLEIQKNKKYPIPSSTTYIKRFGSWNNALKEASLIINQKKFLKQELIENLKILYKELNRIPQPKDLKNRKWAGSYSTYKKYFKTWENAIYEAKLKKTDISSLKKFAKKEKKLKL
ncbi:MAG: hypothetical protein QXE31_04685 [Candidatus Woesearchaeota archaeon]